jgi:hypothetical protein
MSTQHTPGPWVVNPIQLNQIATADAKLEIARATVLRDQHETIANARLIAAAPALIELLQSYSLAIDENNIALSCIEFGAEAVERELKRRAAIAKAMGAA